MKNYDKYIVIRNGFWVLDYTHCLHWCRSPIFGYASEHPDGDDFEWFYGYLDEDDEVVAVK